MPPPRPPRGFDETVPTILPTLSDVRPASVARTLAEAFAKEYAALHAQMQAIYDSGFVETGGDLDALAKLLAFQRRRVESLHAEAEGVLGKRKPKKKTKKKAGKARRRPT